MLESRRRLFIGICMAVAAAAALGLAAGLAADSRVVGAFTFGAVLAVAWIGFMLRIRLTITNEEGEVFRFHPLYVAGISVLIGAISLLLAEFIGLSLATFAVGLALVYKGRARSDSVSEAS